MRTGSRSFGIFLMLLISAIGAGAVWADVEMCDFTAGGEVEAGWSFFVEEPPEWRKGKFEEYRDRSSGPYGNAQLYLISKDQKYLFELLARNAGKDDQDFLLRHSMVGLYQFEFEWNQIPHLYSTVPTIDFPTFDEYRVQWDIARVSFGLTPTPEWDIFTEYSFIHKHGDIPKGVSEEFFALPTDLFEFQQFPYPIKYQQQEGSISAAYVKKDYQLQLSYNASVFNNDLSTLGIVEPALSLPPDNTAHTVTVSGGANLPLHTRMNGLVSYGLRLQDDDLVLPDTIVSPTEPTGDFDGRVDTILANLSVTSHPLEPLTVQGRYQLFHYGDNSDELATPVEYPAPFLPGESITLYLLGDRIPYTKQSGSFDTKWQFPFPVSMNLGYGFESWDRSEEAKLADTAEHTPRIAFNYTPIDWLLIGTSYSHSFRSSDETIQTHEGRIPPPTPVHGTPAARNCSLCHRPGGGGLLPPGHPPVSTTNCRQCHDFSGSGPFPIMSKFNMEDRNRDRFEIFAEITRFNNLTLSFNGGIANDDYDDDHTDLGLQNDKNWFAGFDIAWKPLARLTVSGGYMHEEYDTQQNVGFNSFIAPDPGPSLDTDQHIDTVGVGVNLVLWPEKLDLETKYNCSFASSDFHNQQLPNLDETFYQLIATLRYQLSKNLIARLGYIFEQYDIPSEYEAFPYTDSAQSEYYNDFSAQMVTLSMGYRF